MTKKQFRFPDGVFFTGHRPPDLGGWDEDNDIARQVKRWLYASIVRAIEKGKRTFITGMATGVDIWAAEAVLALKGTYHDLRLVCACPYMSQPDRWARFNKARWRRLMEEADEFHIISDDPPEGANGSEFARRLNGRNHWMVNSAPVGIGVMRSDKASGGTRNCLSYAKRKQCPVLVYDPVTKEEIWENRT